MINFEELTAEIGMSREPRAGEVLEAADFRFEIFDMDRRRIDQVLVMRSVSHFDATGTVI